MAEKKDIKKQDSAKNQDSQAKLEIKPKNQETISRSTSEKTINTNKNTTKGTTNGDSNGQFTVKAHELAKKQREISVAEFFEKNRHLLGFDNKRKALMMTIKEAVDNALDACEEAEIMPEVSVEIISMGNDRFRVIIEDNGPGIVKAQIPNIFAKLLYGSKFHRLKQSLTGDEPIMILDGGLIRIIPIGNFIDKFLAGEGSKDISKQNIKVPAFDWKTHKYQFRTVSHLIKHKRENEVIKIRTATNREIKVTGCHSLFSIKNGIIVEVEARSLKCGDSIVIPKLLPSPEETTEINILDYLTIDDIDKNSLFVYEIKPELFETIIKKARIIHKKTDKSRKYYRIDCEKTCKGINNIDILDDSWKQYTEKGFLPLQIVLKLGLKDRVKNCVIKTYYHGKETILPVTLHLQPYLMRFLGLFAAEGYTDRRQIGLTFGKHEDSLINEAIDFSRRIGLNFTLENRDNSTRVKIFGGILSLLLKKWCGKGAHNKKIPEFVFRASEELRQNFIDGLYQGDGHKVKNRNCLMLNTVSKPLANELVYLWLMQGVAACTTKRKAKGLGKTESICYAISVYGKDINKSQVFKTNLEIRTKRLEHHSEQICNTILIQKSDLMLVKIKDIEIINKGYDFVYDLSVPKCENFVGGFGGIACHNSRGQQGIGISAAVLYSQLTTGRPTKIISKIGPNEPAHYFELKIDTQRNAPDIMKEEKIEWEKEHGTKIEIDLEGAYQKGSQSVDEYIKETAIVNPHITLIYTNPKAEQMIFARVSNDLPVMPKEIKPHPYGIELGMLLKMMDWTESRTLQAFFTTEFSRVGPGTAKEICEKAALPPNSKPSDVNLQQAERLLNAIMDTKIIAPPTDCISPIGSELIEKGMKKEIKAEFFTSVSRPPAVYRGRPFVVEVGIAYGGELPKEEQVIIMRFANRVPLLFQQGACACSSAITGTAWRAYGLQQSSNSIPNGPCVIMIHLASVWAPFTSEAKEALAHYPEIIKEIKLALQEAGRELASYVRKKSKVQDEFKKRGYIEKYLPHVGSALKEILALKDSEEKKVVEILADTLEKTRQSVELDEEGHEVGEDSVGLEMGKKEDDEEAEDEK